MDKPRKRLNVVMKMTRAVCVVTLMISGPVAAAGPQAGHYLAGVKTVDAPAGFDGVCTRYPWVCSTSGTRAQVGREAFEVARAVNATINARVREVSDFSQYKVREYWALPTARGGDCEDFALAKKRELIARGFQPESLLIATVLDRSRNQHAVLVMRTGFGDYVLDNLDSRILHWSETGYSFLRMQDPGAPGSWIAILSGGIFAGA